MTDKGSIMPIRANALRLMRVHNIHRMRTRYGIVTRNHVRQSDKAASVVLHLMRLLEF